MTVCDTNLFQLAKVSFAKINEVWGKYLRERNHMDDLDVDGRIILKLILKKWHGKVCSFHPEHRGAADCCGHRINCWIIP
jgi:hypothetical protein